MGEGRNTLYLARQGWDVTGFDPAGKASALAESRAKQQGLGIHTQVPLDKAFDFGQGQWDLILFSWMPVSELVRCMHGFGKRQIVAPALERVNYWPVGFEESRKAPASS